MDAASYTHTNTDVAVARAENKAGKVYVLMLEANGLWAVYARCANYAAHVHGNISYTLRYCDRNMTEEAARALFARKLKGKAKP